MSSKIILYSLILIGFVSCKESNFVINKDDKGRITEKYAINAENQKHGEHTAYINGALISKATYKNDKLDGPRTIYHSNGKIEIEETYKDDVLVGTYTSYYNNGELAQVAQYDNGVMQGLLKTYYKDGKLKEEVTMVNNQEDGPFKEYHPNGQLKWEGQFLNGDNEFGLLKNYDVSGELIKKMMCDSLGVCSTIWTLEEGNK